MLHKAVQKLSVAERRQVRRALHCMQQISTQFTCLFGLGAAALSCHSYCNVCVGMLEASIPACDSILKGRSLPYDNTMLHFFLLKNARASGTGSYLNRHRAIAGRRARGLPKGGKGQQERARELAKVLPQGGAVCRCCPCSSCRRIVGKGVQQPAPTLLFLLQAGQP